MNSPREITVTANDYPPEALTLNDITANLRNAPDGSTSGYNLASAGMDLLTQWAPRAAKRSEIAELAVLAVTGRNFAGAAMRFGPELAQMELQFRQMVRDLRVKELPRK